MSPNEANQAQLHTTSLAALVRLVELTSQAEEALPEDLVEATEAVTMVQVGRTNNQQTLSSPKNKNETNIFLVQ